MKNINIIIDAVIDSEDAININNSFHKCLEFIINDQIEKKYNDGIDVYNSVCNEFKFTVENTNCENYPNIEKKIKIIMERKK